MYIQQTYQQLGQHSSIVAIVWYNISQQKVFLQAPYCQHKYQRQRHGIQVSLVPETIKFQDCMVKDTKINVKIAVE